MIKNLFDFSAAKILVIGAAGLDSYWDGTIDRISPEAPVPVTHYKSCHDMPSGAALIASIIGNLTNNKQTTLVTALGSDDYENSQKMANILNHYCLGEDNHDLLKCLSNTAQQIRIVSKAQQLLGVEFKAGNIKELGELEILDRKVHSYLKKCNTMIIYDDGSNIINNQYLSQWLDFCQEQQIPILYVPVNNTVFKKFLDINDNKILQKISFCISSHHKYNKLHTDSSFVNKLSATKLLLLDHNDHVLKYIAKDDKDNDLSFTLNEFTTEVDNLIGMQATLCAVFAMALCNKHEIRTAAQLANAAISLTAKNFGQYICDRMELQLAYADDALEHKYSYTKLDCEIKACRERNETIVFANGCFDVLHIGHITYLNEARKYGDKLFVAINSDCSIKRLKGSDRPINNLADRVYMLSQLQMTDWIVPFYTDTPNELLAWLKPDVLVKGGDYKLSEVVGKDIVESYGGRVEVINHEHTDCSSTKIIVAKAEYDVQ